MRYLAVLLFIMTTSLYGQTPEQLLRLAQDVFRSPDGYEFSGTLSVQPPGSSWRVDSKIIIVAPSAPPGGAPGVPGGQVGGQTKFVKIGTGLDPAPTSLSIPFAATAGWNNLAENVATVRETGAEIRSFDGKDIPCRILSVVYKGRSGYPDSSEVIYSICSEKHLVLQRVTSLPYWKRTDPDALWTVVFDSATFHRPAPQWYRDMKDIPDVTVRREWIGKRAPTLRLADLSGKLVALPEQDAGKVILLNFWSLYCGPCTLEMPMLEAIADTHKAEVVLWGVSSDPPDRDQRWLSAHKRAVPTLSDLDNLGSDAYKVHGIPTLVLIGRDGRIKNYWEGPVKETELEDAIKRASH
jgi:peroxiredoxin